MAPVTRSVYRNHQALGRKVKAIGRVVRRMAGGARSSPRLAALRWRRMVNYTWENPRDFSRFNSHVVGYTLDRMMGSSSDEDYTRRVMRLMARYPGIVDASDDLRRMLAGVRQMNRAEGNSQVRVARVYRQMGRTPYYGY